MNIQHLFLRYLRFERGFLACDEVSSYRCIADVLAVDKNKKHILEYELKKTSHDLKVLEKHKIKYSKRTRYITKKIPNGNKLLNRDRKCFRVKGQDFPRPHRFFYVVPEELWLKEQEYLEAEDCGVISYYEDKFNSLNAFSFRTVKNCKLRKKNLQKFDVVIRDILARCTSAYVNLIKKASEAV